MLKRAKSIKLRVLVWAMLLTAVGVRTSKVEAICQTAVFPQTLTYQSPAAALFWNAVALNPLKENLVINGTFAPSIAADTFQLTLKIKNNGEVVATASATVTLSTSVETPFTLTVPMANFQAGPNNNSFVGPHILTVEHVGFPPTCLPPDMDYNVSFYFPIYQYYGGARPGNYIRVISTSSS